MKKKFFALLLVIVMAFTLMACNSSSNDTPSSSGGGAADSGSSNTDNNTPASDTGGGQATAPDSSSEGNLIDRSVFTKTWDLDPSVLGVFELSMSSQDSPTAVQGIFQTEWADLIREATNGGVDITVFLSQTLAASTDVLPATLMGVADIGRITANNFLSQLPVSCLLGLPGTGMDTAEVGTAAIWDILEGGKYKDIFDKEFEGLELLMLWTSGETGLGSNVPITSLDDMKGMKLRTIGGIGVDLGTLLGCAPITMVADDMYDALSKNVLDGYFFDWAGIEGFHLYEITNYYNGRSFYTSPTILAMNIDSWNSLPAEYQEVIKYYTSRAMSMQFAYALDDMNHSARDKYSTPDQHVDFSDEEWEKVEAIAAEYNAGRIAELTSATFDGEQFLNDLKDAARKYN